jgi:C-terminal processing protease CtpA/Prc
MRLGADTTREPRIGIETTADSTGVRVSRVLPGTMGEHAGLRAGDILLTAGGIRVTDQQFGDAYRDRFRDAPEGTPVEFEVQRGDELLALDGALRFETTVIRTLEPDPSPSPAAAAIRDGILRGGGSNRNN